MKCVIYGAGYMGQHIDMDVLNIKYQMVAYCDSNEALVGTVVNCYEVISREELLKKAVSGEIQAIIVAIFSIDARQEISDYLTKKLTPYGVMIEDYFVLRERLVNEYLKKYHRYTEDDWHPKFSEHTYDWLQNIHEEIKYFVNTLAKPEGPCNNLYLHRLKNKRFFSIDNPTKFDIDFEEKLNDDDIVLDIGCGLVTHYGTETSIGKHINLIPVDALAHFYNLVNVKYGNSIEGNDKECKFGLFEFLDYFFKEDSVNYIVINNALEHGINPYKSLIKCIYILKKGGIIHMKHHRAEGIFEFWQGLHKWNVDYNANNDFIIWNKGNSINISQKLKDIADITLTHDEPTEDKLQPEIYINIVKKRDFLLSEYINDDDSQQIAVVITKLMECYAEKVMSEM